MDSGCPGKLCQAGNGFFGLCRCQHHQVRQFVNDHQQIRQFLAIFPGDSFVVIGDMPGARLREFMVALIHLSGDPLQYTDDPFQIHHNRRQQMRDTVIPG